MVRVTVYELIWGWRTVFSWWRHQMETLSATGPLCGEFTGHHTGQWHEALMFCLISTLNKRLNKQSWVGWFEAPTRSLWRHCNAIWSGVGGPCFSLKEWGNRMQNVGCINNMPFLFNVCFYDWLGAYHRQIHFNSTPAFRPKIKCIFKRLIMTS